VTRQRSARLHAESASLAHLRQTHDPALRDAIIEDHLPLARRVAARYASSPESVEDLFQVACLGLVKAVDRFDPGRGAAFSSYAVPTMVGEVRRHFRDHGWALRVPRELQELTLDVLRTRSHLIGTLSREPSVREVARALRVSSSSVLDALEAVSARHAQSLDQPASSEGDADSETIAAQMGCEEPGYERAEQRILLQALRLRLSGDEWRILGLRLVEDLTQRQIAKRVGVSQMTVSRTLRHVRDELVQFAETLDAGSVHEARAGGLCGGSARGQRGPVSAKRPIRRHGSVAGKH
jgi:RNA polymerase sigma-B factor